MGAHDGHLDFHTAPDLFQSLCPCIYIYTSMPCPIHSAPRLLLFASISLQTPCGQQFDLVRTASTWRKFRSLIVSYLFLFFLQIFCKGKKHTHQKKKKKKKKRGKTNCFCTFALWTAAHCDNKSSVHAVRIFHSPVKRRAGWLKG